MKPLDTASFDVEAVDAASLGTGAGGATYSSLEEIAGDTGPLATGDSAGSRRAQAFFSA